MRRINRMTKVRRMRESDTRKMFKIKRVLKGLYIKALVDSWKAEDLIDALEWQDLYLIACDAWYYIIDGRDMKTVYYASDYGYDLINDLMEDGEIIAPKSSYTIDDYIEDGCDEFEDFVQG